MEQGRDEVRVMTVHGAKGLEAPIVFLPDTCTTASAGRSAGGPIGMPDMERPIGTAEPFVWQVKGAGKLAPISAAKAVQDTKERAERDRLLYVAMTRARDRLYVAGFEGKKGRAQGCWYEQIVAGLAGITQAAETAHGTVHRLTSPQTAEFDKPKITFADTMIDVPLPAWATRRVRASPS